MDKRRRVTENDISTFKRMRNNGYSYQKIANITRFNIHTVRKYLDKNFLKKVLLSEDEKYRIVKSLLEEGYSQGYIANYIGESVDDVAVFMSSNDLYKFNSTPSNLITIDMLNKYRDSLAPNQKVKVKIRSELRITDSKMIYETRTAKIIKTYPFIAQTDLGCFTYYDLYKANLNDIKLQSTS